MFNFEELNVLFGKFNDVILHSKLIIKNSKLHRCPMLLRNY
jgi:hypothetical protein